MPEDTEDIEQPLSPEEQAEADQTRRELEAAFEVEATRIHGPPAERRHKNQEFVSRLVAEHSEPVIRGLLVALSRYDRLLCTQFLAETDLARKPLHEIIEPYELGGHRFRIAGIDGSNYTVDIAAGFGTAGDGGRFLIVRNGETYTIKQILVERIS